MFIVIFFFVLENLLLDKIVFPVRGRNLFTFYNLNIKIQILHIEKI